MTYSDRIHKLIHLPQELCIMCGKCCRTIFLEMCSTHEEFQKKMELEPENFHYFIPISHEEASQISSEFVEGVINHFKQQGRDVGFYRCRFVTDDNMCSIHTTRPDLCRKYPRPHRNAVYHPECGYKETAQKNWLEIEKILAELEKKQQEITLKKAALLKQAQEEYTSYYQNDLPELKFKNLPQELCITCGKCCKSVVSYLSPEDLKKKAKKGSLEAIMFLELFKPYDSWDEAQKDDPENFELIAQKLNYRFKDVTFYKCQFLGKNNLCSIYENRPRICKETPYNPWTVMPSVCGFNGWLFERREQVKKVARKLQELKYHLAEYRKTIEFSLSPELLTFLKDLDFYSIHPWNSASDLFNCSKYILFTPVDDEYINVEETFLEINTLLAKLEKVYIC